MEKQKAKKKRIQKEQKLSFGLALKNNQIKLNYIKIKYLNLKNTFQKVIY